MRRLTSREWRLICAGGMAFLAFLVWSLLLNPALQSRHSSLAHLAKIDMVRGAVQNIPLVLRDHRTAHTSPMRTRVTDTARASGLNIRRLDPQGNALSVSLDEVRFTALVQWIDEMATGLRIRVLTAEILRLPAPGYVSARLLLGEF